MLWIAVDVRQGANETREGRSSSLDISCSESTEQSKCQRDANDETLRDDWCFSRLASEINTVSLM